MSRSDKLIRDAQRQLQGRLIEPEPSELERVYAEVQRRAAALLAATRVALSLHEAPDGDWTSYSPASRRRALLVNVASSCRGIIAQLDAPDTEGLPVDPNEREMASLGPSAHLAELERITTGAPFRVGQRVAPDGQRGTYRVIRYEASAGAVLCEREHGPDAGSQRWFVYNVLRKVEP
jgi:hypothetical protein